MRALGAVFVFALFGVSTVACAADAAPDRTPIEATTVQGEKVHLFPNGRWVFLDQGKADVAAKQAAQFPENNVRPAEAQGGLFGLGRTVMPGDKDYNRGSLNPKAR